MVFSREEQATNLLSERAEIIARPAADSSENAQVNSKNDG
jgi:hypothetical protein